MRRILLLLAVVAMLAAMMVVAGPAFATIHDLANSERSAGHAADGTPADTQNPPGITDEGHVAGYTDPDPDNATQAQPILSVQKNPVAAANAFK